MLYLGDFLELAPQVLQPNSVDCVITSPPYALQRRDEYGGVAESEYPSWTVRWMDCVKQALTPTGSVIINISPHIRNGRLSTYFLKTILLLEQQGWYYHECWIWTKPDSLPTAPNGWPRRSYENLHWFSRSSKPYCDPCAGGNYSTRIGVHIKKNAHLYQDKPSPEHDGIARVTNVFSVPLSYNDRNPWNTHPAQYPVALVEKLIPIICPPSGNVLDPFIGSGTTAIAALRQKRSYVGFERQPDYYDIAQRRIQQFEEMPKVIADADEFFNISFS